jgi:acetyl esterase/lipase
MWLTTLALAGDPERWLERERSSEVEAWWQARTEESRAWLAENGQQETIEEWLAWDREHRQRPVALADHRDGTALWARSTYLPADPEHGAPRPRWIRSLSVQGPDDAWPGVEIPRDSGRDSCMGQIQTRAAILVGSREPLGPDDDEPAPCAVSVFEPATGAMRELGRFDLPSALPSLDGASILVAYRPRTHRTALATIDLATGEANEIFRTRRSVVPWLWTADQILAVSDGRAGRSGNGGLRLLVGPPDDLDWLGRGPFWPWLGESEPISLRRDEILLRTDVFGPGTNVVRVDPEEPRWWAWRVLTGERPGMDLVDARVHGDTLLTVWSRDGLQFLEESPYDGGTGRVVDLGGPATWIDIRRSLTPVAWVTVGSPVGVRYYLRSLDGTYTLLREVSLQDAEFRSLAVPSADGTPVPVSLVVPAGEPPAGGRPVLLRVYGGFGISQAVGGIDDVSRAWLAAGGAVGTVHARGGRERGDDWHESAVTKDHPKTFDDLIAVTRGLVDLGVAAPGRVAVTGASNGGLTVVAAVAQDPAAFGAVVAYAGVYDLIRAPKFGHWWPDEYGRLRDEEEGAVLRAESPVHQLPAGPLPPLWLHTGERDPVVAPAHTLKLADAWKDAPGGPIFLTVDPWGTLGGNPRVDKDLE